MDSHLRFYIFALRKDAMERHHAEVSTQRAEKRGPWIVALTGFLFILLQSACTAVMAISGLRLLIGLTSLAAASVLPGFLLAIHTERVRVPMMVVAVLGSLVNLYVLWRIRSLRSRPASQWRVGPITSQQRRSEAIQIAIAILTLVLVLSESLAHHHVHGAFLN